MSKSLGTGIDPLKLIETHGADALRFGLLAMSSSQDVRFSEAKVQQGRDLANKLWNASRLILLNAGEASPAPATATVEDRWILSRLERTVELVGDRHRRLRLRPRRARALPLRLRPISATGTSRSSSRASTTARRRRSQRRGNLLYVLERTLAHGPSADAVRHRGDLELPARTASAELIVAAYPGRRPGAFDDEAEAEVGEAIELTRRAARAGATSPACSPAPTLSARVAGGEPPTARRAPGPASSSPRGGDGASRSPRSGRSRSSPRRTSTPSAVAERLDERRERAAGRGRAGRGQARQRGLRRQGAGRGRRGGAREARALPRRAGGTRLTESSA